MYIDTHIYMLIKNIMKPLGCFVKSSVFFTIFFVNKFKYPRLQVEHPRLQVEYPRLQVEHPRLQVEHPRLQVEYPRLQVEHPRLQVEHPRLQVEYHLHPLISCFFLTKSRQPWKMFSILSKPNRCVFNGNQKVHEIDTIFQQKHGSILATLGNRPLYHGNLRGPPKK